MAFTTSVDLSMTMTAAVPRPDCASFNASKSISTVSKIKLEIPAMDVVLADQLGLVSLIDGGLHDLPFAQEFAADIDVTNMRPHGERGDQTTFDQMLRIVAHDVPVLASSRFGFI